MNTSNFIENYNRIENDNYLLSPNFLLKAFTPTTFHNLGFQTEIKSRNELWKYIDTQHEGRFFQNLSLLGGASQNLSLNYFRKLWIFVSNSQKQSTEN